MNNKKTVGSYVVDALQEKPQEISVEEQQKQMQSEYIKYLLQAVDAGYTTYKSSFFVEVQTKNERLLPNVFRNYFIHRRTCPTPNYDQSAYRYNVEKGQLEYIWTIPARDVCFYFQENASKIAPEEKGLARFVSLFADGTLLRLCKKYNNEKLESTELLN